MSAYLGGGGQDSGNAIALSQTGNGDIFVAGTTNSSTNFPIVPLESPTNDVPGRSAYAGQRRRIRNQDFGGKLPETLALDIESGLPESGRILGVDLGADVVEHRNIKNSGTGTLNFISSGNNVPAITASGDFSISNNTCGIPPNAQLAAGASCSVPWSLRPRKRTAFRRVDN